MFRFHDHTFDPDTGELDGPRGSARLQPKPARLLAMLLEAGGELVEREQIRAALWPDTNVDFDAGLNTCIRQIRMALSESGDATECIETLPKRGYRVVVAVEPGTSDDATTMGQGVPPDATTAVEQEARHDATTAPMPRPDSTVSLPYIVTFVSIAVVAAALLWVELFGYPGGIAGTGSRPAEGPVGNVGETTGTEGTVAATAAARLAVVPFVDPVSDANAAFNRDLTEAFVTALVNAAPDDIVVIGPSTTATYFTDGSSLPDVAAAVNADFVLHGGHRSSADIFFVEVVLPDGEHLYAQRMVLDLGGAATAPEDVVEAMVAAIIESAGR